MIIRRIIDGKETEIELTDVKMTRAGMESERMSTRLCIKSKLEDMFNEGLISKETLQDKDLINDIVVDTLDFIDYNNMSESKAAEAAIEKWVDPVDEQEEE